MISQLVESWFRAKYPDDPAFHDYPPRPECPWCHEDRLPLHELKRHIKYCRLAPRPRQSVRTVSPRKGCDDLFRLTPPKEK
jgi:hypothetical protein